MHCGHELAAHDAQARSASSGVRGASRAVSSAGLIAAGLVAGAMVFSVARSAHPDLARPVAVREAAFAEGDLPALLRDARNASDEDRTRLLKALLSHLRFKDVAALESADPSTARTATIANDWVNFHAETKRQIALVLNDLADTTNGSAVFESVRLPVTLLLGEVLLAGVELEPRALERLIENFYIHAGGIGAGSYGIPLLQAVGRVVQSYAPPEPRLQQQLHKFLLDP